MNPFKIEVVQAFKLPDGSTHTNMEDAAWYLIASTVGGVLGSPEAAESMLAQSTAQPTVKPRIVELLTQLRALFQLTDVAKPARTRAPKAVATPVTPAVMPVPTASAVSTPVAPLVPSVPVADAPVKRKPGRQPGFKVKPKDGKVAKVAKVSKTKAVKPVALPAAIVPPVPVVPPLPTDIPPLPAGLPPVPPPVFGENTPL